MATPKKATRGSVGEETHTHTPMWAPLPLLPLSLPLSLSLSHPPAEMERVRTNEIARTHECAEKEHSATPLYAAAPK